MSDEQTKLIEDALHESARLHEQVARETTASVVRLVTAMQHTFATGGQVLVFGNGGSATDAQHMAAELVGRFIRQRRALPVIALTADTSILTAVANDYAFDRVFSRQVEALGRPGDMAIGISTSGMSANVLAGLQTAKDRGLQTVALTGSDGGFIGSLVDLHVNVPHASTARVQELHRSLIHAICELVERAL